MKLDDRFRGWIDERHAQREAEEAAEQAQKRIDSGDFRGARLEALRELRSKIASAEDQPNLLMYHRELFSLGEEINGYISELEDLEQLRLDQIEKKKLNWTDNLGEFIKEKTIVVNYLLSAAEQATSEDPYSEMNDGSGSLFLQAKHAFGDLVVLPAQAGMIGGQTVTDYIKGNDEVRGVLEDPNKEIILDSLSNQLSSKAAACILSRLTFDKQDVPTFHIPEQSEIEEPGFTVAMYRSALHHAENLQEEFSACLQRMVEKSRQLEEWLQGPMMVDAHRVVGDIRYEGIYNAEAEIKKLNGEADEHLSLAHEQRGAYVVESMEEILTELKKMDELIREKDYLFIYTEENVVLAEQYIEEHPEEFIDEAEEVDDTATQEQ